MSKKIFFGFLIMILGAGVAVAQAYLTTGNSTDSASGTVITAEGANTDIFYEDSQGTSLSTYDASNIEHTVTAEYGFSMLSAPSDFTVTPGDLVTHETYYVTSEGNNDDTNFSYSAIYNHYNEASDWRVRLFEDGALKTTLTSGETTTESPALNDNNHVYIHYDVLVSSEAAGAPNGSYILISTTFETSSTPVGQYTGGNAYTYGGSSEAADVLQDSTSAPLLTLARTFEVDAPKTYSGGTKEAVPGSIISFIMTYSNDGNASAESVIIVDRIPTNTNLAHVNTSGDTDYVFIDVDTGSGESWTVSYSTEEAPNKGYGETAEWTIIGTLSATGTGSWPGNSDTWLSDSAEADAEWIKWEKSQVATDEDGKTLQWGVTIR